MAITEEEKAAAEKAEAGRATCAAAKGHDWELPLQNPFNDSSLMTCDGGCKRCGQKFVVTLTLVPSP